MDDKRLLTPHGQGWHEQTAEGFRVHQDAPGDAHLAFAAAVVRGLEARPRRLEPRFIYDAAGSEIYEQITAQPEYYPMRTEDAILASCAADLAALVGPTTLVELGSGSSTKTRRLLDAWTALGAVSYVPIDVSASAVMGACADLRTRYPSLEVECVVSTFQRALTLVADLRPKTLLFLGSTLGNFEPDAVSAFFRQVSMVTLAGDFFVLGVDLRKDPDVLEAAYADQAGFTERFILNVFRRMNRELGAGVDPEAFAMRSFYDRGLGRVEMWAELLKAQSLTVAPLSRTFELSRGERILVEVSRKFSIDQVREEASRYDLVLRESYTDPDQYFAVLLLQRAEGVPWRELASTNAPAPHRPEASPVGGWRRVPAGAALLGEPPVAKEVAGMELGVAPVSCGEYRRFVQEGGYSPGAWWSDEGRRWLEGAGVSAPLGWEQGLDGRWRVRGVPLDHLQPVSGVCFWEAEAFARWSGARLPLEKEWEKGAAWDPEHGRQLPWPWGDLPPDPQRVNGGGGLPGPVAVGSYPGSVSFYGLHQVLGDVWEWVYGEEGPVLRGGSYLTALPELDCHLRRSASAVHRAEAVGFRLARALPT